MRLIDADAVKFKFPYGFDNNGILMVPYNSCKCSLDDAPTVDAVPVVRCRDCVNVQSAKINKKGFLVCQASGLEITDDDFCSYGERRKTNENHT